MSTQDNVAIFRRSLEAFNTSDRRSEYYRLYAPDAALHAHGVTSVDGLRQFYDAIWAAFPDADLTVEDIAITSPSASKRRILQQRLWPNGSNFFFFGTSRNERSESASPRRIDISSHLCPLSTPFRVPDEW
jgi:hypothetical protein